MSIERPNQITVEKVLEKALALEKEAYEFYDSLLGHAHFEVLRDLLQNLKDEEYKHQRLIEHKLLELRMGRDLGGSEEDMP